MAPYSVKRCNKEKHAILSKIMGGAVPPHLPVLMLLGLANFDAIIPILGYRVWDIITPCQHFCLQIIKFVIPFGKFQKKISPHRKDKTTNEMRLMVFHT